jgi:hypothetical protein
MLKRLVRNLVANYRTMSPEDYLFNQRDSMLAGKAHWAKLEPLPGANHGDALISDEIQLIGVPKGQTPDRVKDFDIFQEMLF